MNPEEYEILSRVEREHWFYRGKREIVSRWIRRLYGEDRSLKVVDCGCGTGYFAQRLIQKGYEVTGVDDHLDSIVRAKALLGENHFREGSAERFPFPPESVDVITLLDVLEHLREDRQALRSLYESLKPGGYLIITVPAFMLLWSDWDRALHHFRRYSSSELLSKVREAGFQISFWNYINIVAFPIVAAIRLLRTLLDPPVDSFNRPENQIPFKPLNRVLEFLFVTLAVQKWIRFPFGVSLLVVAQKNRP